MESEHVGPLYFNIEGEPIDMMAWALLFEIEEYKRVASTEVGPWWVSTVWMGLDHGFGFGGPPLIFETMVFPREGSHVEDRCERYSTLAAALAGHNQIVAELRDA